MVIKPLISPENLARARATIAPVGKRLFGPMPQRDDAIS
jgi:hypothetical protein